MERKKKLSLAYFKETIFRKSTTAERNISAATTSSHDFYQKKKSSFLRGSKSNDILHNKEIMENDDEYKCKENQSSRSRIFNSILKHFQNKGNNSKYSENSKMSRSTEELSIITTAESIFSRDIHRPLINFNDRILKYNKIKNNNLMYQLMKAGWYWGPINRQDAEEKLLDKPDGSFLVRDSSTDQYLLTLSFRSKGITLHSRIEYSYGLFSFYSQPESEGFESIVQLIENCMYFSKRGTYCYSRPRSREYPSFPLRLTNPISRFTHVRSLQYLCRNVIRKNISVDNVNKLPLPPTLKTYIQQGH